MVRYFYAWTPLVLITVLVLLALPWLGLIALFVALLVVLPVLAFATVAAPYLLVRAIARRLHGRISASPQPVAVHSAATQQPTLHGGYAS